MSHAIAIRSITKPPRLAAKSGGISMNIGLSNKKLAKLLGVDEGTVANWEKNTQLPLSRGMGKILSVIHKNTTQ